ncbi:MAG: UDP-N-acetylglucosamine--N-acetylmuramyl-(pentapeptide) pyrophosphoryl-undecaprenol N-acetylglucosamine transferase [Candidatus Liptonbacteria bacterium]
MRIVLTGGGTGGHIYPLLAVHEALVKEAQTNNIQIDVHYVGYIGEFHDLLVEKGISVHSISAGKVRRYFSIQNILDVPKFFIGTVQAWWKLYFLMPDVIFSKGGTGALPVLMAAWFYRIPVMLHESDSTPGLNNLLGGWVASRIAVSFEEAAKYFNPIITVRTGNPIRSDLLSEVTTDQAKAKKELGFDPDKPLTVIIGGSQGSQRINELILRTLTELISFSQVLHQTGRDNFMEVEKLAHATLLQVPVAPGNIPNRYQAVPYFEKELGLAYAAADLVISRASSGIFEIALFGKPILLIPLQESANDHQRGNAYAFADKGGGVVIEEQNLLPHIFIDQVKKLLTDACLTAKMAAASRAFFIPGAAETIASDILVLGT